MYKFYQQNWLGPNFLVHADVLILNAHKYDYKEVAVYYALAALRSLADYKATTKITLDRVYCPVDIDHVKENRLLRIDNTSIHFKYEEVNPKEIH